MLLSTMLWDLHSPTLQQKQWISSTAETMDTFPTGSVSA